MLDLVLCGFQTGADIGGARAARAAGLPTGGWMPAGYLAEDGCHPEYATLYNAREMPTRDYPARTRKNVEECEGVLWFGEITSRGYRCTHDAALRRGVKFPFLIVWRGTEASAVVAWLRENNVRVPLIAGNRESVSPGIGGRAERFLGAVFRQIKGD